MQVQLNFALIILQLIFTFVLMKWHCNELFSLPLDWKLFASGVSVWNGAKGLEGKTVVNPVFYFLDPGWPGI